MTFTQEQMTTLSSFEKYFTTAIKSSWCSYPGHAAIITMKDIMTTIGYKVPVRESCGRCLLDFIKDVGKIYFRDKEEMIAKANDAEAVKATKEDAVAEEAVAPKKKRTRKPKKTEE